MSNNTTRNRAAMKSYYNKKSKGICTYCGSKEPVYNGTVVCYRCWLKKCWYTMNLRLRRNKQYPTYKDKKIEFTKEQFIEWGLHNIPPKDMKKPTVDRTNGSLNYSLDNIQWLSMGDNSRKVTQNGVEEGFLRCPRCKAVYPATLKYFNKSENKSRCKYDVRTPCKECRKKYSREKAREYRRKK